MIKKQDILHFLYGQHFANGLRISFGTIIPTLIGVYFGNLAIGISISFGALIISITDSPGPVTHRRNALLATLVLIFITTLLTQFINQHHILLGIEILVLGFVCAMFAAWGPRAASVGTAVLIMVFLNMHKYEGEINILEYSLFISLGGAWYTILSLSITQFMPYRLAQQEL